MKVLSSDYLVALSWAVTVAIAARVLNIVHRELSVINVVAFFSGNATTLSATMVQNALNQFDGSIRVATSAALEEGADRSPLAPRAGNLNALCPMVISLSAGLELFGFGEDVVQARAVDVAPA